MRFYNIEMKGKFIVEKRTSLPSHTPDDEGRLIYYNNLLYIGDSTAYISAGGEFAACAGYATTAGCATTAGYADAACCSCYAVNATESTTAGNSDCLDGQHGTYYRCANNATGILAIANGGTGDNDAAGARTNLGLTGTSNTTHYHASYHPVCTGVNCFTQVNRFGDCMRITASATDYLLEIVNTYTGGTVGRGLCVYACGITYTGTSLDGSVLAGVSCGASDNAVSIYAYSTGSAGLFWNYGTGANSKGLLGVSNGTSTSAGVCGQADGSGAAVKGNTAYCNTSSKYLKHLYGVCLSNCIRQNPLNIYQYYWEDSNHKGFNMTVGPTAEGFRKTFNLTHNHSGDEYEGLWSVDGVALGLGVENLKEIDKLKQIVIELYSCIQKLEASEG